MRYPALKDRLISGLKCVAAFVLGLSSMLSIAQISPDDLGQCLKIKDLPDRVACYDKIAEQNIAPVVETKVVEATVVETAEPLSEAVVEATEPAPAPATLSVTEYQSSSVPSTSIEEVEQFGKASIKKGEEGESELFDTITALRETVPNSLIITLSSGQVWRQAVPKKFRLKEGDEIRIYPSSWGSSFRLGIVDRPGYIQVRRI